MIKNIVIYWSPKILAVLLGVFFIIFGGFDDSPGLQGVGLVLIVVIIIIVIRGRKNKS